MIGRGCCAKVEASHYTAYLEKKGKAMIAAWPVFLALDSSRYGCIGQRNVPALYCIVTSPAAAAARTAASEVSR